jgi:hypothetical protein
MRYQRGQQIPIECDLSGKADVPPIATITDPNNALFGTLRLPYIPGYSPTSFAYRSLIRLPGGAALGTYQVTFTFTISGLAGSTTASFDAVPGGDSGGEVISLYAYDRPEARYVLAQLGSGKLVQGKNPHL